MEDHGGFVARVTGDGVLSYFGYPVARENDAERAVLSAVRLVGGLPRANQALAARGLPAIAVRIGIHTGRALVAKEAVGAWEDDHSAVGQAVNLAARVQAEAAPNTILVTAETLMLVEGLFDLDPLGAHCLKGISAPVPLFRVKAPAAGGDRLQGRLKRGATRFVGRRAELKRLSDLWLATQTECRCRVAIITGEAGVGKSRLFYEFRQRALSRETALIALNCSELFRNTPLFPIESLIRSRAGFHVDDGDDRRLPQGFKPSGAKRKQKPAGYFRVIKTGGPEAR
jgi:hypothetical protein